MRATTNGRCQRSAPLITSLVEFYIQGRFPFDKLVKFYSLDQINQAAEDSEKGITIKPIVLLA